ncbi:MAG TPA: TonB-dependent receptor [Steroidobacteraceae bacterium]|nr:TonB-dependent receptor [Steroidobacteraceae bacterium]
MLKNRADLQGMYRAPLCLMCALIVGLDGGNHAAADENTELAEIVVTAQKRMENMQRVPIAVTVISAETLEKANVSEFADLAKFAPSMTMTVADQPANSSIIIRGIGTFAFSIAAEPSVLVVIDDVAVGFQAQAFTDLVDLEQVEVLNGPQSTLFGKSASAGVINVTTKAPTNTLTYFGDVRVTNDDEQRYTSSVSGPLSDTVSYRVSIAARSYGGNLDNLATGYKIDDDHTAALRSKIRWQPNDRTDFTLAAHYTGDHAHCCGWPLTRLDPGALLYGVPALTQSVIAPGIIPSSNNTAVRVNQVPIASVSDVGISSHVDRDFGEATLLSISAVNQYKLHDLTDYDTTDADVLQYLTPYTNTEPAGSVPASTTTQEHGGLLQGGDVVVKTISQEFRLRSDGRRALNYLLGAYYSNENLLRNFGRGFGANSEAVANYRAQTHYDNYALFGQTGWLILPRTTLITGLRVNREVSSYTFDNYYKVFHLPATDEPNSDVNTVTTGKLGLQYQLTDALMAFAFAARGYKGVAYDLTSGTTPREAAYFPVKPEKSNDYEAGVRSEWLNRRLVLNATVYNTDYTDFQVQTIAPYLMNTAILANIPKVRTRGLEFEAIAQVTANLHANVGYAYNDARAIDYPLGQCYNGETMPSTCTSSSAFQNLDGATLPNAPKSKEIIGLDYLKRVPGLPLEADLNVSSVWQSAENFVITRDPGTLQPAYGITNLSLTLTPRRNRRFSVAFFCNNLFDRHYAANMANVRGNYTFPTLTGSAYNQQLPRDFDSYFGVRVAFASL